MKFTIATITTLAAVVVAAPIQEFGGIVKRTCGTLTGNALAACQTAKKAACHIGTGGRACDAEPLKVRDTLDNDADTEDILARIAAVNSEEVCINACEVACNSPVFALVQKDCLTACKAKCT